VSRHGHRLSVGFFLEVFEAWMLSCMRILTFDNPRILYKINGSLVIKLSFNLEFARQDVLG
jgi:hypothetical protein